MKVHHPNFVYPYGYFGSHRVLLGSTTLSGTVAQIDYTLPTGYLHFEVAGANILVDSDDSDLYINLSDSTGFITSASYEHCRFVHNSTEGAQAAQGGSSDTKIIASNTAAAGGIGTAAGEGLNFRFNILNAHYTVVMPLVSGFIAMVDASTRASTSRFAGKLSTVMDINGVRLSLSAGNFTSGEVRLYGITT